jgi:hypothetical protein
MVELNIYQVLTWIGGAGCVIAASWILERIPKYMALSSSAKRWIFFGVSTILALGAYSIAVYVPVDILEKLAPFFGIVSSVFGYVFLGKSFHKLDNLNAPENK